MHSKPKLSMFYTPSQNYQLFFEKYEYQSYYCYQIQLPDKLKCGNENLVDLAVRVIDQNMHNILISNSRTTWPTKF